jgi:4,5-DOPA dioxygenase extradiol
MNPPAHPYDLHLAKTGQAEAHALWTPDDGPLPALYISHGAPPLFEDTPWMDELFAWARAIPRPKAILIVSAHWESAPLCLSSTEANTRPVYDFGGFDPMYYRMRYDTPDAGELARSVLAVLPDTEQVHEHRGRGLDHGAWVPLKVMYPEADIPVLQMSLPTDHPERLFELGVRLRRLRDQGVLVIGSGFMTHGLRFMTQEMYLHNVAPAWSAEFDAWAAEALANGDVEELSAYKDRAPGMPYSHPTVEHFTPIFITLGASTDPESPVDTTIEGYMAGLSKRSFQVA